MNRYQKLTKSEVEIWSRSAEVSSYVLGDFRVSIIFPGMSMQAEAGDMAVFEASISQSVVSWL